MNDKIEVVADCRNLLAESVLWDQQRGELVWVNIHDGEIWRRSVATGKTKIHTLPCRVGAVGLRSGGGLVVGIEKGFALFDPRTETLELVASIEQDLSSTRLNDGRCDRDGNFVCGGMNEAPGKGPGSAVYRLSPTGAIERLISDITCANSTCFSLDGKQMYFADMPKAEICVYDYNSSGVSSSRRFCSFDDQLGLPDGSTIDAEGCLWNAQWGAGRVVRYTPDGQIEREIRLPVTNPTCVSFGGPDYRTLYITTATFGLDKQQLAREPLAGAVLAIRPSVQGVPEPMFNG